MDSQLQKYVVRIATPYSVGVGFLLPTYDLIVTTIQVVKDNREVIIDSQYLKSQLVPVRYLDALNGLAFLGVPEAMAGISLELKHLNAGEDGKKVKSFGMPDTARCSSCEGVILKESYNENNIDFLVHNCPISYDCIGGPLFDKEERLIGLNMHVLNDATGKTTVYAFPIQIIEEIAGAFLQLGISGVRCESCKQIVVEAKSLKQKCTNCGANLELPSMAPIYEPIGIASTIEQIILKSGRDIRLTRRGPNAWEIEQGSAKVDISYYDKEGLIMGDAYLCVLPEPRNDKIFEYLLKQNHEIEGLSFSIKGNAIVLSLLIYDGHLNVDTGFELFQNLLVKADHYDNILVEDLGAKWKQPVIINDRKEFQA